MELSWSRHSLSSANPQPKPRTFALCKVSTLKLARAGLSLRIGGPNLSQNFLQGTLLFFSTYTILEPEPSPVDPLGFLRPSAALTDTLFRQFTVLTNHPCYQGLLCSLILHLESKGICLGSKDYARHFREAEAFWGVLNAAAGEGVVNITKFSKMLGDPEGCSRKSIAKVGLFARPGYGTLGHYTSPSVSWGLLDRKAANLTDFGKRLGTAWQERGNLPFLERLEAWDSGATFNPEEQADLIATYVLSALPSEAEAAVWREVIAAYCTREPEIRALWNRPLEPELLEEMLGNADSSVYAEFFPKVLEHYADTPVLVERIETARQFEILSALCQQVFEWEYVRRLDEARSNLPDLSPIEMRLAAALTEGSRTYLERPNARDARQLLRRLATAQGYADVTKIVIAHHAEHQRSKGVGAYLDEKDVLVGGRYEAPKVLEQMQGMLDREISIQALTPGRRREWHFARCRRWYDYSQGSRA